MNQSGFFFFFGNEWTWQIYKWQKSVLWSGEKKKKRVQFTELIRSSKPDLEINVLFLFRFLIITSNQNKTLNESIWLWFRCILGLIDSLQVSRFKSRIVFQPEFVLTWSETTSLRCSQTSSAISHLVKEPHGGGEHARVLFRHTKTFKWVILCQKPNYFGSDPSTCKDQESFANLFSRVQKSNGRVGVMTDVTTCHQRLRPFVSMTIVETALRRRSLE